MRIPEEIRRGKPEARYACRMEGCGWYRAEDLRWCIGDGGGEPSGFYCEAHQGIGDMGWLDVRKSLQALLDFERGELEAESKLKSDVMWWALDFEGEDRGPAHTMAFAAAGYDFGEEGEDRRAPSSVWDWRSCGVLLEKIPEIRGRFDRVAAIGRGWANAVGDWDGSMSRAMSYLEGRDGEGDEDGERGAEGGRGE